jgi:hypothetical protein
VQELWRTLAKLVTEKASGLFIWVKLVVAELIIGLIDGDSDQELVDKLVGLPDKLEQLYTRIFDNIPQRYPPDTINYLQLLLQAEEPMTLLELSFYRALSRYLFRAVWRNIRQGGDRLIF